MKEPVTYRPFRAQPVLQQGLLPIERDNGDLERRVAAGLARIADMYAGKAEQEAEMKARMDVQRDVYSGAPTPATVTGGEPSGTASPNGQAGHVKGAQSGVRVYTGDAYGQVAALLRHEEGFRDTPYWDTNAYRVGYGSDTTTLADGRVVKVTPGMKITRDDAERDLVYRLSQREGAQVRRQIGEQAFAAMPANVQAGLLSVGYNYGSLPSDVLAAAKTGDPAQIAAAVRALPANSKRRQREADLIAGNGHAAVDGVATLPNRDGPVRVVPVIAPVKIEPGKAGTWRPTGQNTIYGRIYDVEGTRTFLQLAKQTIVQEQAQLYDQYKDNPAQLKQAYDQLLEQHKREGTYFDEIAPEYEHSFAMSASAYLGRARSEQLQRQRETDAVEFKDRISSMEDRKSQMLVGLDPNDETAASALADAQNDIDNHYDSAVSRGMMTPEEAGNAKRKSRSDMVVGFYTKQAQNLSAGEIEQRYTQMRDDYAAGKLEGVTADDWQQIEKNFLAARNAREAMDEKADKDLDARGKSIAERVAAGIPVTPEEIAQLQVDAKTAPNGQAIVNSTLISLRVADGIRKLPVGELERKLPELLGPDASEADRAHARKLIEQHKAALKTDLVGVAERIGVIPPDSGLPLDGGADATAVQNAMLARISSAEAAAKYFGVTPRYFKAGDAERINALVKSDPQQALEVAQGLVAAGGRKAEKMLAEIGEGAPAVQLAGNILVDGGDRAAAADLLAGYGKTPDGKNYVDIPALKRIPVANELGGSAMLYNPEQLRAADAGAAAIARKRLYDAGIDPKSEDARDIYERALNEAVGARYVGDAQYGGFGDYDPGVGWSSRRVLAPNTIRADQFQDVVETLTDADVAGVKAKNGKEWTAADFKKAYPVAVNGGYAFALGDPVNGDPQFIADAAGNPVVLDIAGMRDKLAPRLPEAWQ